MHTQVWEPKSIGEYFLTRKNIFFGGEGEFSSDQSSIFSTHQIPILQLRIPVYVPYTHMA
jgi:hypothetical protein